MSEDGGKNRTAKDRRTTRRPVDAFVIAPADQATIPTEALVNTPELLVSEPVSNALSHKLVSDEPAPAMPAPAMPSPEMPSPAPPAKKPSLVMPAVLALLLGGGAGLAGGLYGPALLNRDAPPTTSAFQRLQGDVAALASRPAAPASDTLQQRLSQTETALKTEMQTLAAALAELRARPGAAATDILPLASRLSALEQAAANRTAPNLGAPVYVVTMGLAQAAEQGRGFAGELTALEQLGVAPARLAALKPFAATGLPAVQRMAQNFAPIARQITEASTPKAEGIMGWAQSLVKVRATGANALTTIDAALRGGDLAAAMTLLDTLPDAQKTIAAPFAGALRARIAASEAVSALQQAATAGLQTSATGKPAP